MMDEIASLQIAHFTRELESLKSQNAQLQQATDGLKAGQEELARIQQEQGRIMRRIESVTNEHQRAIQQHDVELQRIKENELIILKEIELVKADVWILKKRTEVQELERQQRSIREERLQQLVGTFHALHNAVVHISKQESYFDKYVWLSHFNDQLGVNSLNPDELSTVSDRIIASKAKEDFKQELLKSKQLLTKDDIQDINSLVSLKAEIPESELKLGKMKRQIAEESNRLSELKNKLTRIEAMRGFSPVTLRVFQISGYTFMLGGILLAFLKVFSGQGPISASNYFIEFGVALLLIGALVLWVRHANDKQNRLKDTTTELTDLKSKHSDHTGASESLQSKILQDKEKLQAILMRHPVLKVVAITHT